ncbi:MAG TPA: vitamin K epoxide reductase family protein [Polyangiaceae bacterium]|nr:vitamin K epoxide reductase family protein [Polyangiaceae bacterium]
MQTDLALDRKAMRAPGRNPSRWTKRTTVLVLTLIGLVVAARLAAYQLHLASLPPDPIFGAGTERVLDSPLSHWLPVPDAVLGASAYAAEAVLVVLGRNDRFRTAPLLVFAYAAVALGMGVTAVVLVLYQAIGLRSGCTLCLGSALLSLLLAPPAFFEARATLRERARRLGRRDSVSRRNATVR